MTHAQRAVARRDETRRRHRRRIWPLVLLLAAVVRLLWYTHTPSTLLPQSAVKSSTVLTFGVHT